MRQEEQDSHGDDEILKQRQNTFDNPFRPNFEVRNQMVEISYAKTANAISLADDGVLFCEVL